MNNSIERDLGEQPIARIMIADGLSPHDIVAASTKQMTHKMISRAAKGRRLTPPVQLKILNALNKATGKNYSLRDLFNY
ncbi:MAG: hypothetical protein Q7J72_05260 [Candidatus Omnitrophota bacterium]|nr:hypothetical protein [Candidatus Omnitrophota bacterium]